MHCAAELARLGWTSFFCTHFHHQYSSINPTLANIPHPAAPYLARLARHGIPALWSTPPWSVTQQDAAMCRGPHPSAAYQFSEFLLEDMFDYATMGYWMVLPYSALRGHPRLKLAPTGVVPQRDRRPRPTIDYSLNQVNQTSLPLAPLGAMQFGGALQRLFQRIAYCNPAFGPPLLTKVDLADGYYRIPLSSNAALQLAVCLPFDGFEEPLVGVPLSLPLGWSLSPPFFCAYTETFADLTNAPVSAILQPGQPLPQMEVPSLHLPRNPTFHPNAIFPFNIRLPPRRLSYTDVYLDDFMLAAQAPNHSLLM